MGTAHPTMTRSRIKRLGAATLAAFILAIASSVHGAAFLSNPIADSQHVIGGTALSVMTDLVGGILSCVLAVIYLRHLFRSPAAPRTRTAWTLGILILGPFAMPFYWWFQVRGAPYSSLPALKGSAVTEEDARLLAAISVAPPTQRDTP